ncbi:Hypothetical protein ORPV_793 [Orpheovirus IHUMI-LCC2]|uniref:Uncharacterized protein n=1 Tax=Orpheovirus IHUMI-LCC2 TaxID=2023057 RepID=A0A2I2L595_9VIRU|nr:Hypothetical protein ORPV_793 [Orpheovirus IHUMI-LCC2]SNW62697.1 Hypothetical protein ORPV_793 [Orpheovirus IHUMI-LCC2]
MGLLYSKETDSHNQDYFNEERIIDECKKLNESFIGELRNIPTSSTLSHRKQSTFENEDTEEILLDQWKIEVRYTKDGTPIHNSLEYVSPVTKTFFNVDSLRDGMTLSLTPSNYMSMPSVMQKIFIGRRFEKAQLDENKNNFIKRVNPTFFLDLDTIQIRFWLTKRKIGTDKKTA